MKTKVNKTAPQTKPRVNVITLGCSKNIHDSEVLMGQLKGNQMDVVHESDKLFEDDIIVKEFCD